jgi:hypothetical protein
MGFRAVSRRKRYLVLRHFSMAAALITGTRYIFRLGQLRLNARERKVSMDTTYLILALAEPETTYFDIGTNIGLLSTPA